jgi:choline dehydrogenase-like flavoprotein
VRGVGGLRVADAGVMPTITSGNTNSDADDRGPGPDLRRWARR